MSKYVVILSNVGSCADRFMPSGYDEPVGLKELFRRVSSIPQVKGVELIGNWHDDYLFQADYGRERDWLCQELRDVCEYRPDVNISLEYKIKEPRTHSYIGTAAVSLLLDRSFEADL